MKKYRFLAIVLAGVLILTNLYSYRLGTIRAGKDKLQQKKLADSRSFPDEKTMETLRDIYEKIQTEYYQDVTASDLNEGLLRGLVETLGDPYSTYLSAKDYEKFSENMAGKYSGIGLIVTPGDDGKITVVSPIKGGPAFRAGIKSGDKILKVDGEAFPADKMQDAVLKMRGEDGASVKLTLSRDGKEFEVSLNREVIKLETIDGRVLEGGIGYIGISEFDEPTAEDFKAEFQVLKKRGIKGLILDLRGNPGGLLDVCADVVDTFLDKGTICYTQNKKGEKDYYESDAAKDPIPLVVLVNEGSASASEIVSGALQDRKRAKLVGTTTFGKGIVQRIFHLPYGQAVKLTVSEYFTPNGRNIHKVGIKPDYVVELPENVTTIGPDVLDKDVQLKKAIEVLKGEIK